jgi:hypothetical protein
MPPSWGEVIMLGYLDFLFFSYSGRIGRMPFGSA